MKVVGHTIAPDSSSFAIAPTISLPAIPDVTVTRDRPETKPTGPTIRDSDRHKLRGVALASTIRSRRVEWFMQALHDVAEGWV